MINKKEVFICGTRPEIIKLALLIKKLKPFLIHTGQHKELSDDAFNIFNIKPDLNLKLMKRNQTLTVFISKCIKKLDKVVKKIRKLIDVFWAFVYENDEIFYQEIALYKVPTKVFLNGEKAEHLVRNNGARILVIEEDFIIIEKTGHQHETKDLLEKLKPYGVMEFVRSGRIAISKSTRRTDLFLQELHDHY